MRLYRRLKSLSSGTSGDGVGGIGGVGGTNIIYNLRGKGGSTISSKVVISPTVTITTRPLEVYGDIPAVPPKPKTLKITVGSKIQYAITSGVYGKTIYPSTPVSITGTILFNTARIPSVGFSRVLTVITSNEVRPSYLHTTSTLIISPALHANVSEVLRPTIRRTFVLPTVSNKTTATIPVHSKRDPLLHSKHLDVYYALPASNTRSVLSSTIRRTGLPTPVSNKTSSTLTVATTGKTLHVSSPSIIPVSSYQASTLVVNSTKPYSSTLPY